MAFNSASVSFSRFHILDEASDELILSVPDKLRQFSFRDIDDTDDVRSFGWVPYGDMLDTAWQHSTPHLGEYLIFSLRLDTRRIPPAVLKKHAELAMREEKAKMPPGQKFIAKNRKKEIAENVQKKLYARCLPVPAVFNVLWKPAKNEIWFASIQGKMIDLFMEFFTNTFELHLEQLLPSALSQSFLDEKQYAELENLNESHFI